MKNKITLIALFFFFAVNISWACFFATTFCYEATLVNNEIIAVGTITNSSPNSVQFNIISVLYGAENNSSITIWDGAIIDCTGPWPNRANDMGMVGDTILCLVEPIISVQNPWDVIGDYRRPSLLGGLTLYNNFSQGILFDNTYTYNEVLTLDIASHCCDVLNQWLVLNITSLPTSTGSSTPITLTGNPQGGTFSGTGVVFNAFNPSVAGTGNHTITYTYQEEFGCSFSTQEDIFVFTIIYNFVNYNLGTIAPKIIELEVAEPDRYTFQVLNINGKLLHQESISLEPGIHSKEVRLNEKLPKGMYLLNIANSKTNSSERFFVSGY